MQKNDFKDHAKKMGMTQTALLKVLGKPARCLERIKGDQEIPQSLVEALETYTKTPQKPTQPTQCGEKTHKNIHTCGQNAHKTHTDAEKPTQEPAQPTQNARKNPHDVGFCVSNKDYHASENMSASKIKLIIENAKKFHDAYVSKVAQKKYTDALMVGNVHHTLTLEPHKFKDDYYLSADSSANKPQYIEAIRELGGDLEVIINNKGIETVKETVPELKEVLDRLREKDPRTFILHKHLDLAKETSAKALHSDYVIEAQGNEIFNEKLSTVIGLKNSFVERTFYGEIEGVPFQVRPDLLMNLGRNEDIWFCVDLKTAENATMSNFTQQSGDLFYDVQEWIYREILKQNGINVIDFRFCVTGKVDGSGSEYYRLDKYEIEDAEKITRQAIKKYKYCMQHNVWREGRFDYESMRFEPVTTVRLPTYRKHKMLDMGIL